MAHRPPPSDDAYRRRLCLTNVETLCTALHYLYRQCGRLPTAREGLVSLIHDPGMDGWEGPYVFELKPDPWGRAFGFERLGEGFRVYSAGPDGEEGTGDDIVIVRASGDYAPGSVPGVYSTSLKPVEPDS